MQTYLRIYRKEEGTGGHFTNKNRVFPSKSRRVEKRHMLGRGRVPGESALQQGFQIILERGVGSSLLFHIWTALRKMLHKSDGFVIKMGHE